MQTFNTFETTYKVEKVLPPALSFDTAHEVDNYPYGSMKTKMRFWVEKRKGFGFRPVTCTLNPKTGRWNKPHNGNYTEGLALYIEAETGHTKFCHFHHFHTGDAQKFFDIFKDGLCEDGLRIIQRYIAYESKQKE